MTGIPVDRRGPVHPGVLGADRLATLQQRPAVRPSGFAAALALSVLMLPTVHPIIRGDAAARADRPPLRAPTHWGIPKWKTILKIVLPTAARRHRQPASMLAVARACGETAPVFLVAGVSDSINSNPFFGPGRSRSRPTSTPRPAWPHHTGAPAGRGRRH